MATNTAMTYKFRAREPLGYLFTFSSAVGAGAGGTEEITVSGYRVSPNDIVLIVPHATLDAGLIMSQPPRVTGANKITFFWYNTTGAPITPTAFRADFIGF